MAGTVRLQLTVTEETAEHLAYLTGRLGVKRSALVSMLINDEFNQTKAEENALTPPPTK